MDDMFHICLMTEQNLYKVIRKFKSNLDGNLSFLLLCAASFHITIPFADHIKHKSTHKKDKQFIWRSTLH